MWSNFDDDDFIIIFSSGKCEYVYDGRVKDVPEKFKHNLYDWYELGNSELADYMLIEFLL